MLLFILACGSLDEEGFRAELASTSCATYERCSVLWLWDDDLAACEEDAFAVGEVTEESCAGYDGKAARQCVDDWAVLSCESVLSGETPETCEAVCGAALDTGG